MASRSGGDAGGGDELTEPVAAVPGTADDAGGLRIRAIRAYPLRVPMTQTWVMGRATLEASTAVLVRVDTNDGLTGWGECAARLAARPVAAFVRDVIAPRLVGELVAPAARWRQMIGLLESWGHRRGAYTEAVSGVDIALWDVAGKARAVPLWVLWGGGRSTVPTYASSVFLGPPTAMVDLAERWAVQGYRAIKVKVGRAPSEELAMLRTMRETLGGGVELLVDANGAYGLEEALWLAERAVDLDVGWFEEPLPAEDRAGYARLAVDCPLPLAAGESEFDCRGMLGLLEAGVYIAQPNVTRAGGFTEVLRIIRLAHAMGRRYAPHTGVGAGLHEVASLHLAAGAPNLVRVEHMLVENPLRDALLQWHPRPTRDGELPVPQRPGLGVDIEEAALTRLLEGDGREP